MTLALSIIIQLLRDINFAVLNWDIHFLLMSTTILFSVSILLGTLMATFICFLLFSFTEELSPVLPGKWRMFSCSGMTDSFNISSMLRFSLPHCVLSIGCKIPKVVDLEVHGELVEGNVVRGHAKVAWCGGIPGKGVSRWVCFLSALKICYVCLPAW